MLVQLERLTPFRIAVTAVIKLWTRFHNSSASICLLKLAHRLILYHEQYLEPSYQVLLDICASDLTLDLSRRLETMLCNIDSPDNLVDYMNTLEGLLSNQGDVSGPLMDPESPIALYLQTAVIAFHNQSFAQVGALYRYLRSFIEKIPLTFVITEQCLQLFIHEKVKRIEKQLGCVGTSYEVDPDLLQLLQKCPHVPQLHFLQYTLCLLMRDCTGAEDSLHAYFDMEGSEPKSIFLHYAALNLAIFYFHFGRFEEALDTLVESMHLVHKSRDSIALQFVLDQMTKIMISMKQFEKATKIVDQTLRHVAAGDRYQSWMLAAHISLEGPSTDTQLAMRCIEQSLRDLIASEIDSSIALSLSSTLLLMRSTLHLCNGDLKVSQSINEIVISSKDELDRSSTATAALNLAVHSESDSYAVDQALEQHSMYNGQTAKAMGKKFQIFLKKGEFEKAFQVKKNIDALFSFVKDDELEFQKAVVTMQYELAMGNMHNAYEAGERFLTRKGNSISLEMNREIETLKREIWRMT